MKTSLYLTVSNAFGKILTMFIWILIARIASPSDFSFLAYFRSTLNTLSSSVNYGYTNYIIKASVNRGYQRKQFLITIFGLFTAAANLIIGLILLLGLILQWFPLDFTTSFFLILSIVSNLWTQILLAADQARKHFFSTILCNLILVLIPAFGLLALFIFGRELFAFFYATTSIIVLVIVAKTVSISPVDLMRIYTKSGISNFRIMAINHNYRAFKLTGIPFLAALPLINLKWITETQLLEPYPKEIGIYYIAMMLYSFCMTLLYSASQPILVDITADPKKKWSRENIYANFALMGVISVIIISIPEKMYTYALPKYDSNELNLYFGYALILGLLISYRQGFGRIAIVSGKTEILTLENIFSAVAFLVLSTFFISEPIQILHALIFISILVNFLYLLWVYLIFRKTLLMHFFLIHVLIILTWRFII